MDQINILVNDKPVDQIVIYDLIREFIDGTEMDENYNNISLTDLMHTIEVYVDSCVEYDSYNI